MEELQRLLLRNGNGGTCYPKSSLPPREYQVLYLDILKKWPIKSLLVEEPDELENCMIQSHTTEIHLVKTVRIERHLKTVRMVKTRELLQLQLLMMMKNITHQKSKAQHINVHLKNSA